MKGAYAAESSGSRPTQRRGRIGRKSRTARQHALLALFASPRPTHRRYPSRSTISSSSDILLGGVCARLLCSLDESV